jgi:hypothetical protein
MKACGGVSFTPLPLNPRGNIPQYSLYTRLGGPQSRPERCGEEILPPACLLNSFFDLEDGGDMFLRNVG